MTVYDKINTSVALNTMVTLIKNGLMNSKVITYINIYDRFYQLSGEKTDRYNQIAEEYNLSPRTVRHIIEKLNKKAK